MKFRTKSRKSNSRNVDIPLDVEILKQNAGLICEAVEANQVVVLFKCEGCAKLHMRFEGSRTNIQ